MVTIGYVVFVQGCSLFRLKNGLREAIKGYFQPYVEEVTAREVANAKLSDLLQPVENSTSRLSDIKEQRMMDGFPVITQKLASLLRKPFFVVSEVLSNGI